MILGATASGLQNLINPLSIPGMIAWYDVTDVTKVTTAGGGTTISVLQDKSGNARHLDSSGSGLPLYNTSGGANNKAYLTIANNRELNLTGSVTAVPIPYSIYIVLKQTSFTDGKYLFNFISGNVGQIQQYTQPAGNSTVVYAGNYFNRNTNGYKLNQWEILSCVVNNVNSKFQVNNEAFKIGGYAPGQTGNGSLNYLGFGPYYKNADAQISEVIVYNSQLSATNDKAIRTYLSTKYAIGNTPYIAFLGDSITAGAAATNNESTSFAALTAAEKGLDIINYGEPGSVAISRPGATGSAGANLENIYTNAQTGHLPSGYFCFAYGTNDVQPDATWKANYKTILQDFITKGADPNKIIICSPPYRNGYEITWLLTIQTYCSQIASELGIKYFDAITYMAANGGQSLMSGDGVHPSDAGHRVFADGLKLQIV